MELKATVVEALAVERGVSRSGREWEKATLIVEYGDARYPRRVALMALKNAEKFAAVPVGSEVVFQIDIESHEFNGRWYTSVTCWKWDVLGGGAAGTGDKRGAGLVADCDGGTPSPPVGGTPSLPGGGGDDLPF